MPVTVRCGPSVTRLKKHPLPLEATLSQVHPQTRMFLSFPPPVQLPDCSFSLVQVTTASTPCSVSNIPLSAPSLLSPLSRSPIPITAVFSYHWCHLPPLGSKAQEPNSLQCPHFPSSRTPPPWAPLPAPQAPCPSLQPPSATSPSPVPPRPRPLCCACQAPGGPAAFTSCGKCSVS